MKATATPLMQWYRNALLIEALEIAINSLEFDGEYIKAASFSMLLEDIKEAK